MLSISCKFDFSDFCSVVTVHLWRSPSFACDASKNSTSVYETYSNIILGIISFVRISQFLLLSYSHFVMHLAFAAC